MRTTSIKSVYLSEKEVREMVFDLIASKNEQIAKHMIDNKYELEFTENGELQVMLDGEFDDSDERDF